MIRLGAEKHGQSRADKAGHPYPAEEARVANARDNAPFGVTAWRRAYMRPWRAGSRAGQAPEPEPQVEENPVVEAPPVKERKPPPKGERKARWAARAEGMKIAENMLIDETRAMLEHGSGLRAHVGAPGMTAPGYRMRRTGGLLRRAVEAYLRGGEMTPTGLMALQAYLKRSITAPNWRGEGVEGLRERVEDLRERVEDLRERVEDLDTREKLEAWLDDALDIGIDPL